tara:strand:- start:21912 stop:22157 length:246 start_codon:yes stop_codon:yes gene_type:complete
MSDCICKGNWRLIVKEYEDLIGKMYLDSKESCFRLSGILHAEDDYYYFMSGMDGSYRLLSCVGSIEQMGFSTQKNEGVLNE